MMIRLCLAAALLLSLSAKLSAKTESIIVAGGCFWCMEPPFDKLPGVLGTESGYTGGPEKSPTYRQVAGGKTGHTEAVRVTFDSDKITLAQILDVFWRNINPTDAGGQFVDRGPQYRSGIFYQDEKQKQAALASKARLKRLGKFKQPIVTEITRATAFYPAEAYHQDFYKKSSSRYRYYRSRSGRDQFLRRIWGKPPKS